VSLSSPLCERATDPRALGVGTEEDRPRVAHGRRDRCVPTRPSTLNPNPKIRPGQPVTRQFRCPSRLGLIPRTRRETGDERARTFPYPSLTCTTHATRLHVSPSTTTDEIPRLRTDTRFAHVSTRIVTHEPVLSLPTFRGRDGCPRRRRSVARHPPTRAPRGPCAARSARSPLTPSPLDASAGPHNLFARSHPAN
jgi:hypothetical protein